MKAKLKSKLNTADRVRLEEVIPLTTPFLIYLDPSSACNFSCIFCPSGHKDIIKKSGYKRGVMSLALFEKIVQDFAEFDRPIKVLRMNKIGEPFLNKNLDKMIRTAKQSGLVEYIDLATNGSLLSGDYTEKIIDAGIDRLNISVEGVNREQYKTYAGYDMDFQELVNNVKFLYASRKECEITVKIPGNYLTEDQKEFFLDTFGNYCDRIFIEDIAPIWPHFDIKENSGICVEKTKGQYKQSIEDKQVCTYIFYSMAINSDGSVSACCPDWEQKLILGDANRESLIKIWNSDRLKGLRVTHLEGNRHLDPVCSHCRHIAYCQIDNIDAHKHTILERLQNREKPGR